LLTAFLESQDGDKAQQQQQQQGAPSYNVGQPSNPPQQQAQAQRTQHAARERSQDASKGRNEPTARVNDLLPPPLQSKAASSALASSTDIGMGRGGSKDRQSSTDIGCLSVQPALNVQRHVDPPLGPR